MSCSIQIAAAVAALGVLACGPPCEQDAFECGEGNGFSFDDACSIDGDLELVLGQGIDEFDPLVEGEEPEVHDGNQGLQHMFLALRVENPALDYPLLKVAFDAAVNDPCAEPGCQPWVSTATREVVIGPELPVDGDGGVTQTGLILIVGIWPEDLERRIRVDVIDPCHRQGSIEHRLTPP